MRFIFIIIILFFLFFNHQITEAFPDERQFLPCSDIRAHGLTNYKVRRNHLDKPLKGFYSAYLRVAGKKDYSEYYQSPICENKHDFQEDYFNDNKVINYHENEWEPLEDPFSYSKPTDNYLIEYPHETYDRSFLNEYQKYKEEIKHRKYDL
jgi:hypothetical protein